MINSSGKEMLWFYTKVVVEGDQKTLRSVRLDKLEERQVDTWEN